MNTALDPNDPFSLQGKRILVTGASSGIGRQIALSCAEMGAQLVISGRNEGRLAETFATLEGTGHEHVIANLDKQEDIDHLVASVGVLDGVAHAAGIARLAPFRMINRAQLDETFASNVYAPLLLTRGLLAKKRINTRGSILFISAVGSHIGPVATAAYSSSKAALLGAMRTLALEVAKHGMRANCIVPGYVRTPMLDGLKQSGGNIDEHAKLTPLGLGEPEDVAYAAVFYLSDASRWVTRNYFLVDGGLTVPMDIYA
ncbi:SDR family NAD(P)-dependent oxidoreductase [Xanthomonas pisi]|uniref:NAD(P)-dependent oxidoreductase n=1 Tax=Xanthomonas pisi TaxID=56457 RepID=A0A2S7CVJ4_9XANT|nr:SDR family oxidoreductase [Xanthomonas pisi]KLD70705.1 3-oxoacyl-ACP reductase [Xanthomonas pisi DSM 18956]PPU65514.1 NAD(P)-dependent oxidoreductase [Xanthomonas pisi]